MKKIIIDFKCTPHYSSDSEYQAEFARQVEMQSKGLNDLSVQEYLTNRNNYIQAKRSREGSAAQREARRDAFEDKVVEFREKGLSFPEAWAKAEEWMGTQAALHNPDQVAGGNPTDVSEMGDARVNKSIGSQWGQGRAEQLYSQIAAAITDDLKSAGVNDKQINEVLSGKFENCSAEVKNYLINANLNVELRVQGIGQNTVIEQEASRPYLEELESKNDFEVE